jgi:choline dehydrogenase-like flavoprotein
MSCRIIQFNGHQPNALSKPEPGKQYMTLICMLTHPLSRGSVHLARADPLSPPAIDPNYFANEADMDLVVHILERALQLLKTPPLSELVKRPKWPPQELLDRGREGLQEFIKENTRPVYHPVGTAAMMPREDGGVVDATLKVYGTRNLHVVRFPQFWLSHM